MRETSIAIVGAGIIGASTALALQKDGHDVTLIDREGPCAGASFGNAGAIVNGSCVPTAMPGIVFDALRMLNQPLPPLSIRAAYFPQILPWLFRFVLESRRSRVSRNATNLHALTSHAVEGWRKLTDNTELASLLYDKGWLKVYESERSFNATANARQLMDRIGTPYEILSATEIRDIEPRLAPIFSRGILQRDCLNIINPQRMVQGMVDLFVRRGGTYRQFDARTLDITDREVRLRNSQAVMSADKVVIATGAWSRSLASQVGDNVPLDTERGYHLMLPMDSVKLLERPVVNGEASFVLSPMESSLRITSQVELGGLDCEPDYRRVRSLLNVVKRMLPDIDTTEQSVWMGFRPSLPDSLPILGFSPNTDRVLYAFGHQHLGMTMGPISGLIIADLVAGRKPGVDLSPYRADRF